jgi:hypothetical protein
MVKAYAGPGEWVTEVMQIHGGYGYAEGNCQSAVCRHAVLSIFEGADGHVSQSHSSQIVRARVRATTRWSPVSLSVNDARQQGRPGRLVSLRGPRRSGRVGVIAHRTRARLGVAVSANFAEFCGDRRRSIRGIGGRRLPFITDDLLHGSGALDRWASLAER